MLSSKSFYHFETREGMSRFKINLIMLSLKSYYNFETRQGMSRFKINLIMLSLKSYYHFETRSKNKLLWFWNFKAIWISIHSIYWEKGFWDDKKIREFRAQNRWYFLSKKSENLLLFQAWQIQRWKEAQRLNGLRKYFLSLQDDWILSK